MIWSADQLEAPMFAWKMETAKARLSELLAPALGKRDPNGDHCTRAGCSCGVVAPRL